MKARNVINFPIAPGNMLDLKARATAFESIAAITAGPGTFVSEDGKPEQITTAGVTPNFFTVLGTKIGFDAPPKRTALRRRLHRLRSGQPPVPPNPALASAMSILSHLLGAKFGSDSAIIGKTIRLFGGRRQSSALPVPTQPRLVFPSEPASRPNLT
jgi:hypothetical protein